MTDTLLWTANAVTAAIIVAALTWAFFRRSNGQTQTEPPVRLRRIAVILLLLVGVALRIWGLGDTPPGFNQDEASSAYDAWALNTYGIDRNGDHNPVYAVAWGSGQNVLYTGLYRLIMPLLGHSVLSFRMVSLLLGCLSLWVFYLTIRRTSGTHAALAALGLLAVSPWHVMLCRWGLESNILPAFLLFGAYFALRTGENRRWLLLCFAFFGLALYAYATAYVVVPLLALAVCIGYIRTHKAHIRTPGFWIPLVAGGTVLALMALPLILSVLVNRLGWEPINWGFLTIPKLTQARYESTMSLDVVANLGRFAGTILLRQDDGLIWNAAPGLGCLYYMSMPLMIAGAAVAAKRRNAGDMLLWCWFLACVLLSAVTEVNINRINAVFLPLLGFGGIGIAWLWQRERRGVWLTAAAYAFMAVLFVQSYFTTVRDGLAVQFMEGLGEAAAYASEQTDGAVYVTGIANAPYVAVLLYTHTPPGEFLDTVDWLNPGGAFRSPRSFGRYIFGIPENPAGEAAYVAHVNELGRFSQEDYEIVRFGHYAAVMPEMG